MKIEIKTPKKASRLTYGSVMQSVDSMLIASLAEQEDRFITILTPDIETSERLYHEVSYCLKGLERFPVYHFPDWEILPYDQFSPHQDIVSRRLEILHALLNTSHRGLLLISINTAMQLMCPKSFILHHALFLKQGDSLSFNGFVENLLEAGYGPSDQVRLHGEFSKRGSLIDLFPMGTEHPLRLDFFDDTLDSIRAFDVDSQRTIHQVEKIRLLPAKEFPTNKEAIALFKQKWRDFFQGNPTQSDLYKSVSDGIIPSGIAFYFPLFFEKTGSIFDYLPENTLLCQMGSIEDKANQHFQLFNDRYEQYRYDRTHPLLLPKHLCFAVNDFFEQCNAFSRLILKKEKLEEKTGIQNLPVSPLPELTLSQTSDLASNQTLNNLIKNQKHIIFSAESAGRLDTVQQLFNKLSWKVSKQLDWKSQNKLFDTPVLVQSPFVAGFLYHDRQHPFALITENELLGRHVSQKRLRKKHQESDLIIRHLAELTIGEPLIHIQHGLGRYEGLVPMQLNNQTQEFLLLTYAGEDKLYVPVTSLHLIHQYTGIAQEKIQYHHLGQGKWEQAKKKAFEKIRDTAAELLNLYAKRQAEQGFAFKAHEEDYQNFVEQFPFEETYEQHQAIEAVKNDMFSSKPMDRVICGDVGFGKTEVAMRAVFIAALNEKQSAVLVPTTLLAQQHYQNFCDRFASFGVNIALLSRFKSAKDQKTTLEQLEKGAIDVIIGTHALITGKIQFKDLGLLVVDEEHRFGVRQKEKIKALKARIDILTLTATPIPRTLNMAMSGIRDLSLITTPPMKRLSVKTFVREYRMPLIQEAIARELTRGGQVYFVHNQVDTINSKAEEIQKLIPHAKIAVAHGQMSELALERTMIDFYHRRINVLVCTTIIETGIDVPNANTIVIDNADRFGMAQMHQLRGRVGRSHHQAYAFFLIRNPKQITKDAQKRLKAIEALDQLGAGFQLASEDLEIRGAGELLGEEQSGSIEAIGLTFYTHLLNKAVKSLQAGETIDKDFSIDSGVELDLSIPAYIPEDYVPDVHTRLVLYKRMNKVEDLKNFKPYKEELLDRFGKLPDAVENLLEVFKLKIKADKLGIVKIHCGKKGGTVTFGSNVTFSPEKVVKLVQDRPQEYKFMGANKLSFTTLLDKPKQRVNYIEKLLESLH